MKKTTIDMHSYARKAHFDYFRTMDNPHVGVTVMTDVSELLAHCRKNGISFFLSFLHAAALAANRVPEFRQRIRNDGIVEYDFCGTSHTEATEDGRYCYCTLYHHMPFDEYLSYAQQERKACLERNSIEEEENVDSLFFVSSLPWLSYSSLVQPTCKEESNPRITWGKYEAGSDGRISMPVTVLCHHALVDGLHISRFYCNLQEEMAAIIR